MQDVTAESTSLRDTEHLARFTLTCGASTGYTMPAAPGQYTLVAASCSMTWESSGGAGDDGGCGRYVTLST
jgi:hypothetical protein